MTPWRRLRGDEGGSIATLTVLSVIAVLAAVGPALVAVTDFAATAARARAVADAAALAGAGTSFLVSGGPLAGGPPAGDAAAAPDGAARQVTAANGAVFVRSDLRSWPLRYGVTVEVVPRTGWVRAIAGPLRAGAVAAVRPRVPIPGS